MHTPCMRPPPSLQVRVCAFRKLSVLVDGRLLAPAARVQLTAFGLTDAAADARRAAVLMLAKWMADYGYSFTDFLLVRWRRGYRI